MTSTELDSSGNTGFDKYGPSFFKSSGVGLESQSRFSEADLTGGRINTVAVCFSGNAGNRVEKAPRKPHKKGQEKGQEDNSVKSLLMRGQNPKQS